MKSPISILLLSATLALAEPPEAIQRITLDERVVVTVPVATAVNPLLVTVITHVPFADPNTRPSGPSATLVGKFS